jgi:UPF0042 nucleotide-binding protein
VVHIVSFGFRHNNDPEADLTLDCRILRNPHRDKKLRYLDGRDSQVVKDVRNSPGFPAFMRDAVEFIKETKPHSVAIGCFAGRHRSVVVAQELAEVLAREGWPIHLHHRELGT